MKQKGVTQSMIYTDEELTMLLQTRPYRNYLISLALMYKEFKNYQLMKTACQEAMTVTEGFTDVYNRQIYYSAELLLTEFENSLPQVKLSKICPTLSLSTYVQNMPTDDTPSLTLKKLDH